MKYLLDTCTFLWIAIDSPELSETAREEFQDPHHDFFLSAASVWEIVVKHSLRKLSLPEKPEFLIPKLRKKYLIESIPMDEDSALGIRKLPPIHDDPFDRMLVAQALTHNLSILTPDSLIHQYPAKCMW